MSSSNVVNRAPSKSNTTQVVSNLLNTSSALVQATAVNNTVDNGALSTNLLTSAIQIAQSGNLKTAVDNGAVSANLLTSAIQIAKPGTSIAQKTADKNVQSLLNIAMTIAFPKPSVSAFPEFPGFPDFSSMFVIPEQSKRIGETILTINENASAYEKDGKMIPEKHKATKSVVKPIYESSKTKPDAYESTLFDGMPDSLIVDNSKEIGSLMDQVTEINANLKKESDLLKQ
jgi:hypothetical protein